MNIPTTQTLTISNKAITLSGREVEVLQFILAGCTNPEIAKRLHLSTSTIKSHVRNIMNKLGADHRVQIAVIALESGFVQR
ncbi:MAG: hypothetical protein Kow00121_39210 [Elainellaceae cyanobacterium]